MINKLFSKKFADSGSPAYDVLKKMKLTNEDQEVVAKAIAGDKVDPARPAPTGSRTTRTRSTSGSSRPLTDPRGIGRAPPRRGSPRSRGGASG